MAENCSNDGVNADVGGDGKRKVDCEGEADMMMVIMIKLIVMMIQMVVVVIARMMGIRIVFLRIDVLMGKVVMRLMMVMSKLRVLQVAWLNVVEVPNWK